MHIWFIVNVLLVVAFFVIGWSKKYSQRNWSPAQLAAWEESDEGQRFFFWFGLLSLVGLVSGALYIAATLIGSA